ncbi:hypothetical protein AD945_05830 [Gluconobacter albidus]|uniref:Uncharacterized protein n=1 Tax=Gluconobacter albidus TaxID=318683 RepID=A0A149TKA0_9PROT|nr:hypothetical protein AD945_05830 [Gluconobacter albidus]
MPLGLVERYLADVCQTRGTEMVQQTTQIGLGCLGARLCLSIGRDRMGKGYNGPLAIDAFLPEFGFALRPLFFRLLGVRSS